MKNQQKIETPSGKGASDENFPVGSFLIAKELRSHVAAYYDFARAIDDIADNPQASASEKTERLEAMDAALADGHDAGNAELAKAHRLRHSFAETGVDPAHGRNLIVAFKQDVEKNRYATWAELMGYCSNSASPVGRFLLELHGEDRMYFRQSDALCNALQVINHLQDCKDDFKSLDRSYLPGIWLRAKGEVPEAVMKDKASDGLREVFNQCLAGTRDLLQEADKLPQALMSRRLAMETSVILKIAWALHDLLLLQDPVARRVELNKLQLAKCTMSGAWRGFWR